MAKEINVKISINDKIDAPMTKPRNPPISEAIWYMVYSSISSIRRYESTFWYWKSILKEERF